MVCRELGFGVEWTDNRQRKVNLIRVGKTYSNEEATMRLSGTSKKKELTSSPFVVEFEQQLSEISSMSAQLIKKVVKLYKSHRNIVDKEKGWIKIIMLLMYQ